MPANFATVKLARDLVDDARREAELVHRSLGSQIEYWATLGRAVEAARSVSVQHVRQSLAGEPPAEALEALNEDGVFDRLTERFRAPSPETRARYAALGAKRGAVGDVGGVLSRRNADGPLEPV